MNYYPFHIGDYLSATRHLSWEEDAAYRRLLDTYYTTEKALPADLRAVCRLVLATTDGQREAVRVVLEEFFKLTNEGWTNGRADTEILTMRDKQQKQRDKANKRWQKPATEPGTAPALPQHPEIDAAASNIDADAMPPTPTPTPKVIPPTPPKGGRKPAPVGLKAWLETIKASGEKPIPETDPVFTYAAEVGIPDEFLRLAWLEFRHRYAQPDVKRYRDWRAVFRKAVRGNWMKLWFVSSDGSFGLTTVGYQAQRAHDDRRAA